MADPSFELNLKDLKRPSIPAPTPVKPASVKSKTEKRTAQQKKSAPPRQPAKNATVQIARPAAVTATPKDIRLPAKPLKTPGTAETRTKDTPLCINPQHHLNTVENSPGIWDPAAETQICFTPYQSDTKPSAVAEKKPQTVATDTSKAEPKPDTKAAIDKEPPVIIEADTICRLACRLISSIATIVAPEELTGSLAITAAGKGAVYDGVSALLACSLSRAEEYTLARLLQMHDTGIIPISEDDSIDSMVDTVAGVMGIGFGRISGKDNSYLFRSENGEMLFIKLIKKPAGIR